MTFTTTKLFLARQVPAACPQMHASCGASQAPNAMPLTTQGPNRICPLLPKAPNGMPLTTEGPNGMPLTTQGPNGMPLTTQGPNGICPLLPKAQMGRPLLLQSSMPCISTIAGWQLNNTTRQAAQHSTGRCLELPCPAQAAPQSCVEATHTDQTDTQRRWQLHVVLEEAEEPHVAKEVREVWPQCWRHLWVAKQKPAQRRQQHRGSTRHACYGLGMLAHARLAFTPCRRPSA
eukprot:365326-Chlamydomonas_euryale.AAC.12